MLAFAVLKNECSCFVVSGRLGMCIVECDPIRAEEYCAKAQHLEPKSHSFLLARSWGVLQPALSTPLPMTNTRPTLSFPMTLGSDGRSGYRPWMRYKSFMLIGACLTPISTWPAAGAGGSGRSASSGTIRGCDEDDASAISDGTERSATSNSAG